MISAVLMRHESNEPTLQEGASGEKMPTLQKELEQLHTDAGQMKALPQDAPFSLLMLEWQWLLCGRTVQLRLKLSIFSPQYTLHYSQVEPDGAQQQRAIAQLEQKYQQHAIAQLEQSQQSSWLSWFSRC